MNSDRAVHEFWIDVGGTFTDTILRLDDGRLVCHKTLSSGIVKGAVAAGSSNESIVDRSRTADPDDFWRDWKIRQLDDAGRVVAERRVTHFDRRLGRLDVDRPWDVLPRPGQLYELSSTAPAPLIAIRYLLGLPLDAPLPRLSIRLGTTRGTNALLTGQGARVAWITTEGFADALAIGYQARPQLFDLTIRKHDPQIGVVVEIAERMSSQGVPLRTPDELRVVEQLRELQHQGIDSLAITLLHACVNPVHETMVANIARQLGFRYVSVSSELSSLRKFIPRGDTTVVNARLQPLLHDYLATIETACQLQQPADLRIMTSAGGLVDRAAFQGKDSLLSGPAGGVVGLAGFARSMQWPRVLGFDMGGTSTDVSRYEGELRYDYEIEKAGVRLATPMLAIETVAAGGGSICAFDGMKLTVGPQSAGADPGPACYGRGGPLTITDLHVFLGRLPASAFPFPLDRAAVARALDAVRGQLPTTHAEAMTPARLAEGFLRIANHQMAQAIRSISLAQGYNPVDYHLIAFGGAAPLHACDVARELGIATVGIPAQGSLLSALGMGLADLRHHQEASLQEPWLACRERLPEIFTRLTRTAEAEIIRQGISPDRIECRRSLDLRVVGTEAPLTIAEPADGDYPRALEQLHRQRFGYWRDAASIEVVMVRVEAIGHCGWSLPNSSLSSRYVAQPSHFETWQSPAGARSIARFDRNDLRTGAEIVGPAVIVDRHSTTVIEEGWRANLGAQGELVLFLPIGPAHDAAPTHDDPVWLEVFHRQFAAIAEQMGITLRNTSHSVNVRERLDFSCAVFTRDGDLVANAPHVPVHLGAMSDTVRHVLAAHRDLQPGDVVITNDPLQGGSHLPDITVITPVFDASGTELRWFVANRAHHAEIGGVTPGSMPPFSRTLAEEGVLLTSFKLYERGNERTEELLRRLTQAPYPSRDPATNLADVAAQVAANRQGIRDLEILERRHGWHTVAHYMERIQQATADKVQRALQRIPRGVHSFADAMDEGAPIMVRIVHNGPTTRIDFTGSAPVQPTNLNANRSIVKAAVMYSLRCLLAEDIPLNEGVLAPIELIVPAGILQPPRPHDLREAPAVAAGNVETSQRIVDVLLGAWQLAAASQGTMNNLLFGDNTFGYYETIGGGSGATPQAAGADAVHTHMTNTRLTDPEVLEHRYPVRLVRCAIRRGSGGSGRHDGGHGMIREFEFLRPLIVSLVTQRRGPFPPFGLQGGEPGALGQNQWLPAGSATWQSLSARAQIEVQAGDRLRMETPGGGGYGCDAKS